MLHYAQAELRSTIVRSLEYLGMYIGDDDFSLSICDKKFTYPINHTLQM